MKNAMLDGETQTQTQTEAHFTGPHIASVQHSSGNTIVRVLPVPMTWPRGPQLKILRECTAFAADYANAALAEWWMKKKWHVEKSPTEFVGYGDRLSSYARDAITDNVKGIIQRLGRLVLSGKQQLPTFTRDRVLSVRADAGHAGAKVVGLERIQLQPRPAPAEW